MTGWLSTRFGRKRYFVASISAFTVCSMLCGAAWNLRAMVVFRVLQGLAGAAMLPSSQAILMEAFPPAEQPTAMAVWGMGLMVAPVIGPTLGGWITDTYTWRWCFYINLPFGIIAALMCLRFLCEPPAAARVRTRPDWPGMALLVVGIGAAQIVLDPGERADWFDAGWVSALTLTSIVALATFVAWELRVPEPVVVGRLVRRLDPRLLIGCGVVLLVVGQWQMAHFNLQLGWWQIVGPSIIQGTGLGFIFTLLSTTALARVPRLQLAHAASIYNVMRNMGASFGIAILGTLLVRREQLHQSVLSTWSSPFHEPFARALAAIPDGLAARGVVVGVRESAALLYGQLRAQAAMLAFADTFLVAGGVALAILVGVVFLPYARPAVGEAPPAL
jgi:MFS family permease